MKDVKRRLETFSFYDRTGLERHLAEMARKGWLLEKIGQFLWTYRRIEPKALTFSVCYFPKASQFDPEPSEEQQTFYDFCAHSGWTLAASNAQLQVFYNERENPVPIETDPVLEVEAIHRTMKRSFIPSQLMLLALAVLNGALFVSRLADDPIEVLSSSANLFTGFCWALLLVLMGTELFSYFRWHKKAALAAERGEVFTTRSHRKLEFAVLALLFLGMTVYYFSIAVSGSWELAAVSLLVFCVYMPGLFLLVWSVKGWLKRRKTPARANMAVTFVAAVVVACTFAGAVTFGVTFGDRHGWLGRERETYEFQGRTYTLDRDPLPLALEDLLEGDFSHYTRRRQANWSPLLARESIHQWPIGPAAFFFPEPAYLDYEIILVKVPFLYGLCREAKLHERDDWGGGDPDDVWYGYAYAPADPAPWGAAEAYCWTTDGAPSNQFLLFYPDRIVEISFDHGLRFTRSQMKLVGERLGG